MTKSLPKLVLSSSRDIPFSQLVLSQKNVRRVKAGLSIEDLAGDIYHRTLLQSLNVRAMLDEDGKETGMFEVPAGGRRFRALELLVKTKRMAKEQPVPCVVREGGIAEEDSLAENVMREGLHPLDQFRAFSALIEAGLSEEDIAARFFVSVSTVRQRLRLRAAAMETSAPHDWQGLVAKVPAEAKRGPKRKGQHESDPENAGIRTEPELPIHEDIAPPSKQVANEFDFDHDEQNDNDAARNRTVQDRMRGNARRASLDPGDGIEL